MDSERLEELLKKYWACETTLDEEQALRDYFRTHDVPEAYADTAAMFRYFDEQKKESTSETFEHVVVESVEFNQQPQGKLRSLVINAMRIAAGVAVLWLAVYLVREELREDKTLASSEDTFETPEEAFEETKKALLMISKGFGRAEQQAKKINLFNEAQEKIKSNEKEL